MSAFPTGLSSRAIAQAFHRPISRGDHPHDPDDLRRCRDYCNTVGITPEMISERMPAVSPQWAALAAEWPALLASLAAEEPTGRAPRTYRRMRELLGRPLPEPEQPTEYNCGRCARCDAERRAKLPWPQSLCGPFIVCADCGDKRCPRAAYHGNDCSAARPLPEPEQPAGDDA